VTGVKDEEYLSRGVYDTYTKENLRYSQTIPIRMYDEKNSGTNLPRRSTSTPPNGMKVRVPVRRQGRRLRQQDLPLPGDQGGSEPGQPGALPDEKMKSLARRRARRTTWRS